MKKRNLCISLMLLTIFCLIPTLKTFASGWQEDSSGWWYENSDGSYLYGGFAYINGKNYYFDENGYMKVGWFQDPSAGNWYFADNSGRIYVDELTPDGKYYLDSNGIWDGKIQNSSGTTSQLIPSTTSSIERNTAKATVDGVDMTFYLVESGSTKSGNAVFSAYSLNKDGSLGGYLAFSIDSDVAPGTTLRQNKNNTIRIDYKKSMTSDGPVSAGFREKGQCSVTIDVNESDGSHMEGTFSGVLEHRYISDVTIENGSFNFYHGEKIDAVANLVEGSRKVNSE